MEKNKIRIEIYEGDPFGSTCCGPGPFITSMAAVERLRKMLTERNETVRRLSEEFKDIITINREIISQKRLEYPEHVKKLMFDSKPLPYIFINEEPVLTGKFPTYEEFVALLKTRL
jgi:Fe-S oxidoreductase